MTRSHALTPHMILREFAREFAVIKEEREADLGFIPLGYPTGLEALDKNPIVRIEVSHDSLSETLDTFSVQFVEPAAKLLASKIGDGNIPHAEPDLRLPGADQFKERFRGLSFKMASRYNVGTDAMEFAFAAYV